MSRVDVIVPCYNYGNMLRACVRSVLDQEDADVRVIVMDDASTDSTEAVGRRLAAEDPRVEYRRHATNCGHIATYNEALADVTADYCMILSADDQLAHPTSVGRPVFVRCKTTWITTQIPSRIADGRSSRCRRARTKSQSDPPLRRLESYATTLEKPPTKKKIGMTWNTHVASQSPRVTPMALVVVITPPCYVMTLMSQCPNTTARMLAARRKSM